jgi:hypothetical protein
MKSRKRLNLQKKKKGLSKAVNTQILNLVDQTLNKKVTQSPVPIVVISKKQELEHRHNSLVLSGYQRTQIPHTEKKNRDITSFKTIDYVGKHISELITAHRKFTPICLSTIPKHHVVLLTPYSEIKHEPNIFPVRCDGNDIDDDSKVLLGVTVWSKTKESQQTWSSDDIDLWRSVKPNVIAKNGTAHFHSEGEVYLFGLNPRFDAINKMNILSYAPFVDSKFCLSVLPFHSNAKYHFSVPSCTQT